MCCVWHFKNHVWRYSRRYTVLCNKDYNNHLEINLSNNETLFSWFAVRQPGWPMTVQVTWTTGDSKLLVTERTVLHTLRSLSPYVAPPSSVHIGHYAPADERRVTGWSSTSLCSGSQVLFFMLLRKVLVVEHDVQIHGCAGKTMDGTDKQPDVALNSMKVRF